MKILCGVLVLSVFSIGCATQVANIDENAINGMSGNALGTYSDYGRDITFNAEDGLYHLKIYTGALAGCDGGALQYAKSRLDQFKNSNGFTSYTVVKGEYSPLPLSKCELSVRYSK